MTPTARALRAVVLAAALMMPLSAAGRAPRLTIARLQYDGGGDWYANPSSLPNLLEAIRERIAGKQAGRFRALAMAVPAGIGVAAFAGSPERARVLRDRGIDCLAVATDAGVVTVGVEAVLARSADRPPA